MASNASSTSTGHHRRRDSPQGVAGVKRTVGRDGEQTKDDSVLVFSEFLVFAQLSKRRQRLLFITFLSYCAVTAFFIVIMAQKRNQTLDFTFTSTALETRVIPVLSSWIYSAIEVTGTS
jgi:hypothetical protein